jgi:hypothetical protein
MKKIRIFIVGLLVSTGILSIVTVISGIVYALGRLKDNTNKYRFGPARKIDYLSKIAHRANRALDESAIEEWRSAQEEDRQHYDAIEDEHDRLLREAQKNGTWGKSSK